MLDPDALGWMGQGYLHVHVSLQLQLACCGQESLYEKTPQCTHLTDTLATTLPQVQVQCPPLLQSGSSRAHILY